MTAPKGYSIHLWDCRHTWTINRPTNAAVSQNGVNGLSAKTTRPAVPSTLQRLLHAGVGGPRLSVDDVIVVESPLRDLAEEPERMSCLSETDHCLLLVTSLPSGELRHDHRMGVSDTV